MIRFPLMDHETFINNVLTTKLLLPEESMNIVLKTKGLEPHGTIPFSSIKRKGTFRVQIDENLEVSSKSSGKVECFEVNIGLKDPCKNLYIYSIYYVKDGRNYTTNINGIYLQSQKATNINIILNNKRVQGLQVYRADFGEPHFLKPGQNAIVKFTTENSQNVPLLGQRPIDSQYFYFKDPKHDDGLWFCLVGIKYRTRQF